MAGPFGFQNVDLSTKPAATLVHIGFCKVNNVAMYNHGAQVSVLQIFDLGRVPVLGVDAPTWQFGCPFASTADAATNQFTAEFHAGLKCINGLAYALLTGFGTLSGGNLSNTGTMVGTIDWEIRP